MLLFWNILALAASGAFAYFNGHFLARATFAGVFFYFDFLWLFSIFSMHFRTERWLERLKKDALEAPFFGDCRRDGRVEISTNTIKTWIEDVADSRHLPKYLLGKFFEKIRWRYAEFYEAGIVPFCDSNLEEDYLKKRNRAA